ncbi:MAG TPA: cation-transporting P-type ATPase [Hyphomicrobiales bacterium]
MTTSVGASDLPGLEAFEEIEADRAYQLPVQAVLEKLTVSVDTGLTDEEVTRRRQLYGPNAISVRQKANAFAVLVHQFQSPVVYLLAAAAGLAFYFGEWEEAIAIAAVLALNALIGFITELRAARSIEALRALGTRSARVRRQGHTRLIPADQLVPGDIVLVEGGDAVSADLRLAEASNLGADESALTGESVAVTKTTLPVPANARLAERSSMLFKGTVLTRGSGVGIVVATGLATELGRVSKLVEGAEPGSSPIEKKLGRLSGQLVYATVVLAVGIALVGLLTGKDAFLMVEAAIALAVAAIPEGLPIVATLALARGMWRMARQNALIERLSAVETLGATTIILTDKTGTLTENRMAVRRFWLPSGELEVDGGEVQPAAQNRATSKIAGDRQLSRLLEIAVLCNDASMGRTPEESSGDPMEVALLRAGRLGGMDRTAMLDASPLVRKHAFEAATKMMATVHSRGDEFVFMIKGAPEVVIAACSKVTSDDGDVFLDGAMREEWLSRVDHFAHHGLRVIACAGKQGADAGEAPYEDLTLTGLIGLEDPARVDVPAAIEDCKKAGIRVVMVTGDHAVTARSIGRAVGLEVGHAAVIEGGRLDEIAQSNPRELLEAGIFARVSPAEKLALVRAYQAEGQVVAMTGDGVNDAPALRQADIGVAMGLRGTDVAREAAAMVLLDDAFPTIVSAIREGRVIFGNIRRFVAYLLSCNLSEVLVVGLAVLLSLPLPILPLQILFLNLVTDVFPAFALALGEGERDVLDRPPRNPKESILGRRQWLTVALHSLALTAATFGSMAVAQLGLELDSRSVVTVTFLTLAFAQLWHVFDMRRARANVFRNEITRNRWVWAALVLCSVLLIAPAYTPSLAHVLHLAPPTSTMWSVILGFSLAPAVVIHAATFVTARRPGEPRNRDTSSGSHRPERA